MYYFIIIIIIFQLNTGTTLLHKTLPLPPWPTTQFTPPPWPTPQIQPQHRRPTINTVTHPKNHHKPLSKPSRPIGEPNPTTQHHRWNKNQPLSPRNNPPRPTVSQTPNKTHNKFTTPINTKYPTPIKKISRSVVEDVTVEGLQICRPDLQTASPSFGDPTAHAWRDSTATTATPPQPSRLHCDHRNLTATTASIREPTKKEEGQRKRENSDDGERGWRNKQEKKNYFIKWKCYPNINLRGGVI